ncbi:MAG TPA: type II toxin-antitoxin system prevent-host-death family antitoxin [Gemmatimonadales bacterium]|nr:type II toxin-antitoxin system prevent-host-death family antitoxin [Gemmatimonadales bacterium]
MHEAKTHLSRLLAQVEAGEEVVIARGSVPVARLVSEIPAGVRKFGAYRAAADLPDELFFDPLADGELEAWEG